MLIPPDERTGGRQAAAPQRARGPAAVQPIDPTLEARLLQEARRRYGHAVRDRLQRQHAKKQAALEARLAGQAQASARRLEWGVQLGSCFYPALHCCIGWPPKAHLPATGTRGAAPGPCRAAGSFPKWHPRGAPAGHPSASQVRRRAARHTQCRAPAG